MSIATTQKPDPAHSSAAPQPASDVRAYTVADLARRLTVKPQAAVPNEPAAPRRKKPREELELIDPVTGKSRRDLREVGASAGCKK